MICSPSIIKNRGGHQSTWENLTSRCREAWVPMTNCCWGEGSKSVGNLQPNILLMEEILHQLIGTLVLYPIIYRVLYMPGGAGLLPSTVAFKPWRHPRNEIPKNNVLRPPLMLNDHEAAGVPLNLSANACKPHIVRRPLSFYILQAVWLVTSLLEDNWSAVAQTYHQMNTDP